MKLFTALAALTLIAAPVQAQLNHTGRYYGPDGAYMKCTTVGSYADHATFCKSGAEARDEDRRLEAKNACRKRVDQQQIAKWGVLETVGSETYPVGMYDRDFHERFYKTEFNPVAHAEYRTANRACFTANGFN